MNTLTGVITNPLKRGGKGFQIKPDNDDTDNDNDCNDDNDNEYNDDNDDNDCNDDNQGGNDDKNIILNANFNVSLMFYC